MAAGDHRARYLDGVGPDVEFGPDTEKGDPVAMDRPVEAQERADFYAGEGEKDVLPEHAERRHRYPLITATSA